LVAFGSFHLRWPLLDITLREYVSVTEHVMKAGVLIS